MSLVIFCLLFSLIDYVPVKGEITWNLSLTVWLISLSIMLSSSIHAVAKGISSFSDIPHSNIITDTSPKTRDIKERINKWDLIEIKSFYMAKENSIKIKREPTVWENIFANDT